MAFWTDNLTINEKANRVRDREVKRFCDTTEFQELMAAIDQVTSERHYTDSIARLEEAKEKLLARVVK